jgi:hypothetical protein
MGRFGKHGPKLNEVKAVLQRLQGFPEEPAPASPQPAKEGTRSSRSRAAIVATIIFAQAAALLGVAYVFTHLTTSEPEKPVQSAEPIRSEAVKAALEMARGLMSKGQVRAAREQLLALARKGSPDAAWDVARSYDPNVLTTIPQADASPDIAEATRWYRTWYENAVREGLVANSVSIERIISSMQHAPQR